MNNAVAYDWARDIEPYLDTIQAVDGGFTKATRGIVQIADGTKLFVKVAVDDSTHKWLDKEIEVYLRLNNAGYSHIPQLCAYSDDRAAMAIEYLEGSSFANTWDKTKLDAVMRAQDALKQHGHVFEGDHRFVLEDMIRLENAWPRLSEVKNIDQLNSKLQKFCAAPAITLEQVQKWAELHDDWSVRTDVLVHEDIRADNFGYDPANGIGKLIDWNWLCLSDDSLDVSSLFVSMYLSGFDPYAHYPEKYDPAMLAYLFTYWAIALLDWDEMRHPEERDLRMHQARGARACIELLSCNHGQV